MNTHCVLFRLSPAYTILLHQILITAANMSPVGVMFVINYSDQLCKEMTKPFIYKLNHICGILRAAF